MKPYGYLIISVLQQRLFYESVGTETQTRGTQPECVVLRADTLLWTRARTLMAQPRVKQKIIGLFHCQQQNTVQIKSNTLSLLTL